MGTLLIISFETGSYGTWREVYDSRAAVRAEAGLESMGVYTQPNNPDNVTVIFRAKNAEAARQYVESQGFREAIKRAGVLKEPEIKILQEV